MIKKRLAAAGFIAASLATSGCSRNAKVSRSNTPSVAKQAKAKEKREWERATAVSSMKTAIDRQVKSTAVASVGDPVAQQLRSEMIADPDNVTPRLELAAHYEKQGFGEIAIEHYRLAAQRFPDSAPIHLTLAKSLYKNNFAEEAVEGLESFLSTHPSTDADLHCWLGLAYDKAGDLEGAEKSYKQAILLEPKKDVYYNNLGYNLYLQDRKTEAEIQFRQALQLNGNSETARNNLALVLPGREEALGQLRTNSDLAIAHNNLAAEKIAEGNYGEAREELTIALEHRKDLPQVWNNLRLVSELDGQPVTFPLKTAAPHKPLLKRLAAGFKRAFVETRESSSQSGSLAGASQD